MEKSNAGGALVFGLALAAVAVAFVVLKPTTKKCDPVPEVFESIMPYLQIAYRWDPGTSQWAQILNGDCLEKGMTVAIKVSQACTLSYDDYTVQLLTGTNTFTWRG